VLLGLFDRAQLPDQSDPHITTRLLLSASINQDNKTEGQLSLSLSSSPVLFISPGPQNLTQTIFSLLPSAMSILFQRQYFPAFSELPFALPSSSCDPLIAADEITSIARLSRLSAHWSFMAEIMDISQVRHPKDGILVRDRNRTLVYVILPLPDQQQAQVNPVDRFSLRNGNTIFIRYAVQRWIEAGPSVCCGMHPVVKAESADYLYVVPDSFSVILKAHGSLSLSKVCHFCAKACTRRCKCRQAYYCSSDCQNAHWSSIHKSYCRILARVAPVVDLNTRATGRIPYQRS
jgi:hypothetical protein